MQHVILYVQVFDGVARDDFLVTAERPSIEIFMSLCKNPYSPHTIGQHPVHVMPTPLPTDRSFETEGHIAFCVQAAQCSTMYKSSTTCLHISAYHKISFSCMTHKNILCCFHIQFI